MRKKSIVHDVAATQVLRVVFFFLPRHSYVVSTQLFGLEIKVGCHGRRAHLNSKRLKNSKITYIAARVMRAGGHCVLFHPKLSIIPLPRFDALDRPAGR